MGEKSAKSIFGGLFGALTVGVAVWLTLHLWPWDKDEKAPKAEQMHVPQAEGPVSPLPASVVLNSDQVKLGRLLFHDARLSADNTVSCASCHALDQFGMDGRRVSVGVNGSNGALNAPSVFNSGFNFRQFWDGRAASLEDQVGGPLEHPAEMASSWSQVLAKLAKDDKLEVLSKRAYGRELDEDVVRSAIATFERSLITPDSPFDRYLRGEASALDSRARLGWRRFREFGCIACHQGVNLGGNMYATLGVMGDYFSDRSITKDDLGLYNRTGREEDKFKFKVPSLRNVARTAPYFHDGRVATLDEAVEIMARLQLGVALEKEDRENLVAFLANLTGRPAGGVR